MAYAIVQENFKDNTGSSQGSTASNAWSAPLTAGNAIVVFVFYYAASARTITLSDGGVNTFTQAGTGIFASGFDLGMRCFVATNVTSTSNAITATFNNSTETPAIYCVEVSGIASSSAIAGQAFQRQDNPSADPDLISSGNTGTLTGQPAAVIGLTVDHLKSITANIGAGTGFTALSPIWNYSTGVNFGRAEHKRVTATTAVAATFTAASVPDGTQSFLTGAVAILESTSSSTTVTPGVGSITMQGKTPSTSAFQNVRIREVLVSGSGQVVASAANITLCVWYSGHLGGAPDVSLNGQTTDANGTTSWSIPTGALSYQSPIFYVAQDSISYSNYTCGRLIPNYE